MTTNWLSFGFLCIVCVVDIYTASNMTDECYCCRRSVLRWVCASTCHFCIATTWKKKCVYVVRVRVDVLLLFYWCVALLILHVCISMLLLLLMVVFEPEKKKKQQRNTRIYIYFVRYTYAIYEIANSSDSK